MFTDQKPLKNLIIFRCISDNHLNVTSSIQKFGCKNPADSVSEFNPILHKGFGINESHSVIFGK